MTARTANLEADLATATITGAVNAVPVTVVALPSSTLDPATYVVASTVYDATTVYDSSTGYVNWTVYDATTVYDSSTVYDGSARYEEMRVYVDGVLLLRAYDQGMT